MIRSSLVCLVFISSMGLASPGGAQTDPGTGQGPPTHAGGATPPPTAATGGELIGYTTDGLIPHYRSLDHPSVSTVRQDLVAHGHGLVPVDSLTPGDLDGLDRLILGVVVNGSALSSSQVDVVEDFVLDGGKLVFIGENNTFFNANNAAVGGRFGIAYPTLDPPEVVLDLVGTHPIMQGLFGNVVELDGSSNAPTFYGSMSSPGPGASIVDFPGGNSGCVVIEPGQLGASSGLVVAVAEVNLWDDNRILDGDNRTFWNNIFAYDPPQPECFLVIGPGAGASPFVGASHPFDTQVGPVIEDAYPVLLTDIPEFVLPASGPSLSTGLVGARGQGPTRSPSPPSHWLLDGQLAVQILMWNPQVFPGQPEQWSAGLAIQVLPSGQIVSSPYGSAQGGIDVWAEVGTNAQGQKVLRFPFSIEEM